MKKSNHVYRCHEPKQIHQRLNNIRRTITSLHGQWIGPRKNNIKKWMCKRKLTIIWSNSLIPTWKTVPIYLNLEFKVAEFLYCWTESKNCRSYCIIYLSFLIILINQFYLFKYQNWKFMINQTNNWYQTKLIILYDE